MLNSQTLLSQRVSFLYMIYQSDHLSKTPGVKTHRFCTKLEKHASWKKNDEFFADPFYTFPSEVRQRSPWGPRSLCALIISCHILYQRTLSIVWGRWLASCRHYRQLCHLAFLKPQTIKHNWDNNWRQVKCIQLTISPRTPWLPQQTWRSWICFSKIAKKWMRSCLELNFLQKPTG